jgi:hypothetical protein
LQRENLGRTYILCSDYQDRRSPPQWCHIFDNKNGGKGVGGDLTAAGAWTKTTTDG